MAISVQTYEQLVLEDGDGKWELVCGQLRAKPTMSSAHYDAMWVLIQQFVLQIDPDQFTVRFDGSKVRVSTGSYYVPDLFIVPREWVRRSRELGPGHMEVFTEPLPLVVEVWSPSAGDYDVDTKIPEYRRRGDREIWRIHPYEHTLTAWRRQPDGSSYTETVHRDGTITLLALPWVTIDVAALFA
ncbi:MAG: Uma2 family endonuclease [Dehalococcoidia bacterium]